METIKESLITFVTTLYNNKKATRKDIPIGGISYYYWIGKLKKSNIIVLNGLGEKNEHIHILTPKGKKVAELLIELNSLMNEEHN